MNYEGLRKSFPTTSWTVVAQSKQKNTKAFEATSALCEAYWEPICAYIKSTGIPCADAKDLTQDYFARLLTKNHFHNAEKTKGRLRSFLLTTLKRFLIDCQRKDIAQKRGGGLKNISIDSVDPYGKPQLEVNHDESPDLVFHRQWARTLLGMVMEKLRREWTIRGREAYFEILYPYIPRNSNSEPQISAAVSLDISVSTVRKEIFRLRRVYESLLREELMKTVKTAADVEDELRFLFNVFAERSHQIG